MRTRGARQGGGASPLRSPQLWQFWSRQEDVHAPRAAAPAAAAAELHGGTEAAEEPAADVRGSPSGSPGAPRRVGCGCAAAGAALPRRRIFPARLTPRDAACHLARSSEGGASGGSSGQHRRLWRALSRKSVEQLQAQHQQLTDFESTEADHEALLKIVFDLAGEFDAMRRARGRRPADLCRFAALRGRSGSWPAVA
jgi:hypothetical protein